MQRDHIIALVTTLKRAQPLLPGYLLDELERNPVHGALMAAAAGAIELSVQSPSASSRSTRAAELGEEAGTESGGGSER